MSFGSDLESSKDKSEFEGGSDDGRPRSAYENAKDILSNKSDQDEKDELEMSATVPAKLDTRHKSHAPKK